VLPDESGTAKALNLASSVWHPRQSPVSPSAGDVALSLLQAASHARTRIIDAVINFVFVITSPAILSN
jgi:hypothetical protein